MSSVIYTKRLVLRPFRVTDIDAFAELCADPEVMQYIGNGQPLDRATVEAKVRHWMALYAEQGFGLLAVVPEGEYDCIGFCGLVQQLIDGQYHIELGYRLHKDYWGQGLATEAAQAVKTFTFNQLSLQEVVSIIHPHNKASMRVAEKVGLSRWKETTFQDKPVVIYRAVEEQAILRQA